MDPLSMLTIQIMLFVFLGVGFFLGRKNIISAQGRKELSDLVLYVTLPASIIASFMDQKLSSDLIDQSVTILIVSVCIQIVSIILGYTLFPRSKFSPEDRKIFRYSTINTNASFVALPIINALLGSIGSILTSVAMFPIRIALWTVGIAIFIDEKDPKKKIKNVALNPCMIAVYIGFIIMFLPFRMPAFVIRTFSTIGSGTTFLSMMIVGVVIGHLKLTQLTRPSVLYYCAVRLVIIPLLILAVLKLLKIDETVTIISVIIAGVPAGSFTAILAAKYHSNETLAGQVVLMSTLLSVVTLPLLCLLF